MEQTDITAHLEHKGVKPTANRILVLKALKASAKPMCLADLEEVLWTLDKSSIFRVLTLFLEHDIVHAFEDGRGILNYELCTNEGVCNLSDAHMHFYCESCQQSFCMEDMPLPALQLPEGFSPHSISFVIKGECPQCRKKHM
ncbi:MAG TPA: transcriptional repressor [Candidatus Bacteroides merdigallinarum]|uniref:Transcriptional repressor n=1 Tax=Candidatus Bacteroides merdigallinarum TaxID=2838473 RepID=A0A9D2E9L1_9BACE|nr:transcriptional repressor [Candidatus Bacteroides merdigallinarum]